MKKILLLTTGGTIASEPTGHGLAPVGDAFIRDYDYGKAYRNLYSDINAAEMRQTAPYESRDEEYGTDISCDICVREVCNLDSTNITPDLWGLIAKNIYDGLVDDAGYDGIVVTHGTDTMAYTLAAMQYFLTQVNKPVIFTGSQIPMGMTDSDAEKNLTDAITAAAAGCRGIYLVFDGKIIDSRCAKKVYAKQKAAFESICLPDAGYIAKDGTARFAEEYQKKNAVKRQNEENQFHDIKTDRQVACIKLLPGQTADILEYLIQKDYDGIILEAFGCGGIPDNESGWLSAIERAVKAGTSVYVQSQCTYDGADLSVYEVGQKALKAGALCAENMTTEALCVKLMLEA